MSTSTRASFFDKIVPADWLAFGFFTTSLLLEWFLGKLIVFNCFYTLGSILVDTDNLSPEAGKATPRDMNIVEKLKASLPELDMMDLYDKLKNAKFSIEGLTTNDLLLKVISASIVF